MSNMFFCVDASSDIITAVCKHLGFKHFVIGLHNALAHGKLLDACDIPFTDEDLFVLMEHMEVFMNIVEELDNE